MAFTAGGLMKRSMSLDVDVLDWLRERGKPPLDRSVDWQVRQILRAQMEREQAAEHKVARVG